MYMISILLAILLAIILIKMLILKSNNEELFSNWVSNSFEINKMYNLSDDERKVLKLIKRLGIIFFIVFLFLFLFLLH